MVKKIKIGESKELFQCEQCKMNYQQKEIAQKCEHWCKTYSSCNIEIIKYSVRK